MTCCVRCNCYFQRTEGVIFILDKRNDTQEYRIHCGPESLFAGSIFSVGYYGPLHRDESPSWLRNNGSICDRCIKSALNEKIIRLRDVQINKPFEVYPCYCDRCNSHLSGPTKDNDCSRAIYKDVLINYNEIVRQGQHGPIHQEYQLNYKRFPWWNDLSHVCKTCFQSLRDQKAIIKI